MRSQNEDRPFCSRCGNFYSSLAKFKRHVKEVHEHVKDFRCHPCSKQFIRKENLEKHNLLVHSLSALKEYARSNERMLKKLQEADPRLPLEKSLVKKKFPQCYELLTGSTVLLNLLKVLQEKGLHIQDVVDIDKMREDTEAQMLFCNDDPENDNKSVCGVPKLKRKIKPEKDSNQLIENQGTFGAFAPSKKTKLSLGQAESSLELTGIPTLLPNTRCFQGAPASQEMVSMMHGEMADMNIQQNNPEMSPFNFQTNNCMSPIAFPTPQSSISGPFPPFFQPSLMNNSSCQPPHIFMAAHQPLPSYGAQPFLNSYQPLHQLPTPQYFQQPFYQSQPQQIHCMAPFYSVQRQQASVPQLLQQQPFATNLMGRQFPCSRQFDPRNDHFYHY